MKHQLFSLILFAAIAGCWKIAPSNESKVDAGGDSDSDGDSDADSDEDDEPIDFSPTQSRTFAIEIEDRDWVEPDSTVGQEIGWISPTFALQVTRVDDTILETIVGTLEGDTQDSCNQAVAVIGEVYDNPAFEIGPTPLDLFVVGSYTIGMVTVQDLTITGTMSAEGDHFSGTIEAVMDMRETAKFCEQFSPRTADTACAAISSVAGEEKCFECEDGEPYCILMRAGKIEGVLMDNTFLEERDRDVTCLDD